MLQNQIAVLNAEITALEGAIEAIKLEHVRPSDPIADGAFSLLQSSLDRIEFDRESKEFAAEKSKRVSAAETALSEMRSQLAAKEKEFEKLKETHAKGFAQLKEQADRINTLTANYRSAIEFEIEGMKTIAESITPGSIELNCDRPLNHVLKTFELPIAHVTEKQVAIIPESKRDSYGKPAPQSGYQDYMKAAEPKQLTTEEIQERADRRRGKTQTTGATDFCRSPLSQPGY